MHLRDIQKEAYSTAEDKGFHEKFEALDRWGLSDLKAPVALALIHSEVTEALEADRKDYGDEEFAEELADAVIRIADFAEEMDVNLEVAVLNKMDKNRDRPYRHGGRNY